MMVFDFSLYKSILITGGGSFIGSHLLDSLVPSYAKTQFVNLDLLTYACYHDNNNVVKQFPNYKFIKGSILDKPLIESILKEFEIDCIIHLAAETHVDRSIENPRFFELTNILGTTNLLNSVRNSPFKNNFKRFHFVSTDEVFGGLEPDQYCSEEMLHRPGNPYSASKSAAEMFLRSYGNTYSIPYSISYSSNNYGPRQFTDKLMSKTIADLILNRNITIHGTGLNQRDWLFVKDHCDALNRIIFSPNTINNSYCIGGGNIHTNIEIVNFVCNSFDQIMENEENYSKRLISFTKDRVGNDKRYAVNSHKARTHLGWNPSEKMSIDSTIEWYIRYFDR